MTLKELEANPFKAKKPSKAHRLIIIRGLPGSGKTHYAKKHWPGSLLLEGDQYFTDVDGNYNFGKGHLDNSTKYVDVMLETACKCGVPSIVVTGTSPNAMTAIGYAKIAKHYGYTVKFYWIDYNNGNTNQNRHYLPAEVIRSMKSSWCAITGETLLERTYPLDMFDGSNTVRTTKNYPKWFAEKIAGGQEA